MATTVVDRVLVDSNVLVYSRIATAPLHRQAVDALDLLVASGKSLWVSRQVIREFITSVTRPQSFLTPLPIAQVLSDVRGIEAKTTILDETAAVTQQLLDLLLQVPCGGKQVHDANIVATMLVNGIPNLLTHNVADFARSPR